MKLDKLPEQLAAWIDAGAAKLCIHKLPEKGDSPKPQVGSFEVDEDTDQEELLDQVVKLMEKKGPARFDLVAKDGAGDKLKPGGAKRIDMRESAKAKAKSAKTETEALALAVVASNDQMIHVMGMFAERDQDLVQDRIDAAEEKFEAEADLAISEDGKFWENIGSVLEGIGAPELLPKIVDAVGGLFGRLRPSKKGTKAPGPKARKPKTPKKSAKKK